MSATAKYLLEKALRISAVPPSFFSVPPFRINCGFAGLMTLLPGQNSKEEFTADELRIIWRNVESQNLKKEKC